MRINNPGGGGGTVSRPYLHLPDGWDAGWKTAKAAQTTTPAWMAFLGDSITQGFNSSDQMLKGWPRQVRAGLLAQSGNSLYADFFTPLYQNGTNAPWTLANGTGSASGFGYIAGISSNLSFSATAVSPYACTELDLWSSQLTAGTWTYTLDSGSPVTVTNNTSLFFGVRTNLAGLTNSVHTLVCGSQSVANAVRIMGATFYPNGSSATGLGFAFAGTNGATSGLLAYGNGNGQGWAGRTANNGGTWSPTSPQAPSLMVLALGVNDCSTGTGGPMNYYYTLRGFIQQLRRGNPGCSVLMVAPCYPCPDSSDTSTSFSNTRSWGFYIEAMRRLADEYCCGLVNIHAKWGETPQGQGFIASGSSVHPTDAGHTDIANVILEVV